MKYHIFSFYRILLSLLFFIFTMGIVSAESVWEGSAAMSRYGEFPLSGFYAASNSFSANTLVDVENLDNGEKTTVIVLNRLDNPGLIILLSREASESIGLNQNDVVRVRITLTPDGLTTIVPHSDDLSYNPDPDINPAVSAEDKIDLAFLDKILEQHETVSEEEKPEYSIEQPSQPDTVIEAESSIQPVISDARVSEPDEELSVATPDLPEDPVVSDGLPVVTEYVEAESEVKVDTGTAELPAEYVMPEKSPVSGLKTAESPEEKEIKIAVTEIPEEPEPFDLKESPVYDTGEAVPKAEVFTDIVVTELPEEPAQDMPEISNAYISPESEEEPEIKTTDLPSELVSEEETPLPAETEIILVPTEERPPEIVEKPTAVLEKETAAEEEEIVSAGYPVSASLEKDAFYLQLGAFSEEGTAMKVAGSISSTYPVKVFLSDARNQTNYKVMIGPITLDERGSLLYSFRARGYKDAFIRKGK